MNNNVPQTDDEARENLREGKDQLIGENLVGIFNCQRATGAPTLDAYRHARIAHLEAAGYKFDESGSLIIE